MPNIIDRVRFRQLKNLRRKLRKLDEWYNRQDVKIERTYEGDTLTSIRYTANEVHMKEFDTLQDEIAALLEALK